MKDKQCVWCIPLGLPRTAPNQQAIGVLRSIAIYQRNYLGGLGRELMRQLFVVGYDMRYVNVAVELLDKDILADLISAIPKV